jgi:GTPase involved in cell partitioning and DNA repair
MGRKHWKAKSGDKGMGALKTGASGEDAVILVPPGTLVKDIDTGLLLKDLQHNGDSVIVAKGGQGGRGNKRFATATNQAPREAEPGEPGEARNILLELRAEADRRRRCHRQTECREEHAPQSAVGRNAGDRRLSLHDQVPQPRRRAGG